MSISARFLNRGVAWPPSEAKWRPAVIVRTLPLAASVIAGGATAAEADGIEVVSTLEGESSIDGGSNGNRDGNLSRTIPSRHVLRPRWIEPRRLEAGQSAGGRGSDSSAGTSPEAASALPAAVGSVVRQPLAVRTVASEPDKDWRRAARIVIHGEPINDELSTLTADLLTMLGAEAVERRRVRNSSDVDQIRYFDAADERMARELAAALEPEFGRVLVRDFTAYRPSPESGLLEMWLR